MAELTEEELKIIEAINLFGGTVKGLKQRRFRFTVKVSIGFGAVLLALLCIIAYMFFVLIPHIDANSAKVKKVQCSLYRLVLTSGYKPETRVDKDRSYEENKENLVIYNLGYKTIVNDNNDLGCTLRAEEPTMYITDPNKATTSTTTTTTTPKTLTTRAT